MPRFIGPGCITIVCVLQHGHPARRRGRSGGCTRGRVGKNDAVHPLALDPQHHHRVGLGQHRVEVVGRLDRARCRPDRQQRRRRDQGDLGAERLAAAARWSGPPGCAARRRRSRPGGRRGRRRWRRIVNASSSAWVGCSWVPSPALITLERDPAGVRSWCGAPEAPCRTTTASAPIASSVSAVSLRLSPLLTRRALGREVDDVGARAAWRRPRSEIRVRVESSKKRLTTVRPRRAGSFLIGRSASDAHLLGGVEDQRARRRGSGRRRSAGASSCVPSRWMRHRPSVSVVAPRAATVDPLDQRGGQVLADEVGADRQLAVAAVDQDREPDRLRAGRGR